MYVWFGEPHPYPEEDHIPNWVCRDKHGNEGERVHNHNAACSCAPNVCDMFQLPYPAWFSYHSNWCKVLITKLLIRQLSLAYVSSPPFFYQLYSRNSTLHQIVVIHSRSATEIWVNDWGIKGQFKCTFYSLMITHQKV
jgi:hypothetical protein